MLKKYLWVFFISMLPIIELRGAIPVGAAMGLPFLANYLVCVLGNMLPVPFLIPFSLTIINWCAKLPKIGKFFQRIIYKAYEKSKTFGTAEFWALYAFVAIPLPGTGAWTGCVIAAILRMDMKKAILAIFLGVLTSGLIMGFISFGLFDIILGLFR